MAVDQELIEKTLLQLGKKATEIRNEEREIQKLVSNLTLIQKRGDISPKDPLTDEDMSDERITEIFNSVAKRGKKYIGGKRDV